MVKKEKLLDKARNSPDSLSFSDFEALMTRFDWIFRRHKGSHQVWYSPKGYRLSLQDRKGNAKAYQVKQFLKQLEVEDEA